MKTAPPAFGWVAIGRFAEVQGVLRFHWGQWVGRRSGIIEYK